MSKINKSLRDAFDHVVAEKELIQNTEEAVLRHVRKESKRSQSVKFSKWRNTGLALASVLIFAIAGLFVYLQPVSAVSIDSESSIEIYFNRFNRAIDVISYDEQGNPRSEEISLHNKNFQEVLKEILNDVDADEVYVTVASRNEETASEMMADLSHHEEMMHAMHIYQSSAEVMNRARKSGTSMGRMHAMRQLKESDQDFSSAEIESESTEKLMENFERHHQEMRRQGPGPRSHPNGRKQGGHMHKSR